MRRRVISVGSIVVAVAALVVVLLNATLVDRRAPGVAAVSLSAALEPSANIALTHTAIDVQFSEPVRPATVERRFRIEPYVAGTITWEGSTATFTPSEKLPGDTEFTIVIEPGFEDLAGNVALAGVDGFTFRTVGPPTVTLVEPPGGETGVPVETTVTITFDRLMDTTSVENAIRIEPAASARPSWSGPSLSLAFDSPLDFGTRYTLTIGTGAADTDGSHLRDPYTTMFTTVGAGLAIDATVPGDGGAGVSVRTPIAVLFDAAIDPASISGALTITPPVGGDLRVVPAPDDRVAPRSQEDGLGTVLVFQPSEPLAAHTTYTVTLHPVVARAARPDQVAEARTWRFTTGQPSTSGHNHIAFLSARGGTRDVWLMNPDGSAPRQLTAGLAPVTAFDVTLDGSRVAFAAAGDVRLMSIDGTDERRLTPDDAFEYAPRFAPDGRSLLVARRAADGADAGWWLVPLEPGAGAERQVLPSGAPPLGSTTLTGDGIHPGDGYPVWAGRSAWDPDGRYVLITTAMGDVVLVDLQPDDPDAATVTTGLTAGGQGAWTADGFVVVGRESAAAGDALYLVTTAGEVRRLGEAIGSVSSAPNGAVVHLVRGEDGATHVAVGAVSGRPSTVLTDEERLADRWPTFSPDGQVVVFGRVRVDDITTSAGIWTIDGDGGPAVALTTDGAYPRWLP